MKKIITLIVLIILGTISLLKAQVEEKVKCGFTSSVHYSYNFKSGKIDLRSKYKEYLTNYDANNGDILKETHYNKDGSFRSTRIVGKKTYKYDSKGKIIEELDFVSDGSAINVKYIYVYDVKGNKIETNIYNSSGSFREKIIFKYDDKGRNIETLWASNSKKTCIYDDKGNMIEIMTNDKGSISYKHKCKYDAKGNNIELVDYNNDGSINYRCTKKYDNCGNIIEILNYDKLNKPTYREDIVYLK